jgi:aconitate hydratase
MALNPFGTRSMLESPLGSLTIYSLAALEQAAVGPISRLPFSIKILLENALRRFDGVNITEDDIRALANWDPASTTPRELLFMPARVLLQDFTGVPVVVDLAAMRDAVLQLGGDPARINPLIPVEMVIDHSVQVDQFGSAFALMYNVEKEFERNRERYEFLRWGQQAFDNFEVVPPATGIVHQVNLEFLARGVFTATVAGETLAYPDTLVGTDSHTTMINGLGVLGWGVGGIEAEAAMLGQPLPMLTPEVIGFRLQGQLRPGATATDLVLTVTEILRKEKVVDKFVEFFGVGLSSLSLADRATIANMAPEYGATCGFFPIDAETLRYLRGTGRDEAQVQMVEAYCKAQGLFRTDETPDPIYTKVLSLDLADVVPSVAGPRRPQDRVPLDTLKKSFYTSMKTDFGREVPSWGGNGEQHTTREDLYANAHTPVTVDNAATTLTHGSTVIAAITSCTNTSNPSVMVAAGLVAQKAVARGLTRQPWVKTSMAPGSRVVTEYLNKAGLTPALDALGFNTVGYGCTTCIGNSGPVADEIAAAVKEGNLVVSAVLSGNRNFEGRINPVVRANYLASPPLVVAFAITGTVDIDFAHEPVGVDSAGTPVYLHEIWPTEDEVQETIAHAVNAELFQQQYSNVYEGPEEWRSLPVPSGDQYTWETKSTYIQNPPYFVGMTHEPSPLRPIEGAQLLALLGDSVTTDHISPAGNIAKDSPAGRYLVENGVDPVDFNSYGSRRGNHEVMMRGTFANIRIKNALVPGVEGGITAYLPTGERMAIYDAAMKYQADGTPLVIMAGKEYGTGSSRDWAAKGTALLGVRAVIAESFERIHRSNLVGMGVLPLEFTNGESWQNLSITGGETIQIEGVEQISPRAHLTVRITRTDGSEHLITVRARIDNLIELDYYKHGGVLPMVLRQLAH